MLEVCRYLEFRRTAFASREFNGLTAFVISDDWSGEGTGEFVVEDIQKFAEDLKQLVSCNGDEVWFTASEVDESGQIAVRVRASEREGQFACRIRFATHYDSTPPEGMFRLEIELKTSSSAMKAFVEQLGALANGETIHARLDLEHQGFQSRRLKKRH
jgi:hypothetical protein